MEKVDTASTPSRRRRLYRQIALASFLVFKENAIVCVVRSRCENEAAVKIQGIIRGWIAQQIISVLIKSKKVQAALVLQCFQRRNHDVQILTKLRSEQKLRRLQKSVVLVQCLVRSKSAHREVFFSDWKICGKNRVETIDSYFYKPVSVPLYLLQG
jgi:hypothetical protein